MMYLAVKNWNKFQAKIKPEHRKEFIALHLAVLDDIEFQTLPQSVQVLLIQCWLLRGRIGTNVPYDQRYLHRMLGRCNEDDLQWLVEDGWLIETEDKHPPKDKTAQPKPRDYSPPVYTEEFLEWYKVYPRKAQKADAFKAWEQVEASRPVDLIDQTLAYAQLVSGTEAKFIKMPAGWLRDYRWEDDLKLKRQPKGTKINKILDQEQIDHYAHPQWKVYVSAVTAGEEQPGFEAYLDRQ